MKRILMVLAAGLLLLTGCAAAQPDTRAESLQHKYAALTGCEACADAAVVRDGETRQYKLAVSKNGGETRVTVLEPEGLAGVCAVVSGDALALEFEGMVLDAGSADPNVSAVNATDILLRAAADGYVTERNTERFNGTDALRLCFETEQGGETLYVTVWFDAQDAPLYAEFERDGDILAYLEFTDFAFGDILPIA